MAKKKNNKKRKRVIMITLFCLAINVYIFYSVGTILKEVKDKKEEQKALSVELINLKEEGETLQVEANKLKDPLYVARYAREKYLYSGKNEYIIKIK